uniref:Secreted protein n=1 Tax=Bionectria ochroleuca TaxID=29856 RepID=A0A8H7K566_BIOOC
MVELCLCLVLLLVLPRFGLRNLETRINVALQEPFLTITWRRLAIHVSLLRLVVKFTIEDTMTIKLSMNKAALERPLTDVFVGHTELGPSGVVVNVPNFLLYHFKLTAPMKTPFERFLPATPVLATASSLYAILWHAAWRVNLDVGASMRDGITGVIRTHIEVRGGFVVYGVDVALVLSMGLRT